jgi:hypothetical protein
VDTAAKVTMLRVQLLAATAVQAVAVVVVALKQAVQEIKVDIRQSKVVQVVHRWQTITPQQVQVAVVVDHPLLVQMERALVETLAQVVTEQQIPSLDHQ